MLSPALHPGVYEDEESALPIDAHERSVDSWDEALVIMLAQIDAAKTISTSYPDVLMDDAQVGKPPARFRSATHRCANHLACWVFAQRFREFPDRHALSPLRNGLFTFGCLDTK
jgi:hypothetical protein